MLSIRGGGYATSESLFLAGPRLAHYTLLPQEGVSSQVCQRQEPLAFLGIRGQESLRIMYLELGAAEG